MVDVFFNQSSYSVDERDGVLMVCVGITPVVLQRQILVDLTLSNEDGTATRKTNWEHKIMP